MVSLCREITCRTVCCGKFVLGRSRAGLFVVVSLCRGDHVQDCLLW